MNPFGVRELDDRRLATPNLVPGTRVYDEDLVRLGTEEWRTWNPTRSKLAAYLLKGGRVWPFAAGTRVLYLGAANGTTPSHVSDVVREGLVFALEFSARSFRDLLAISADRPNMVPIFGDAWRPDAYARLVGDPHVLYQDIAQRQQAQVFSLNVERFRPKTAMLMIKARSVDVARDPRDVFREVVAEVEQRTGYRPVDLVDLGPFERDHACAVFEPGAAKPHRDERPPRREDRPRDGAHGKPKGKPYGKPGGKPGGYPPKSGGFRPGGAKPWHKGPKGNR